MLNKSPFSADDRAKRPNLNVHRSLGDLDTSYRAGSPTSPERQERAKQIAVRDVSGSPTDEEPMHAFMIPNKYLKPNAAGQMPPKRPLGARPEATGAKQPVKMYSQVATFDTPMPRVRRVRTAIPVEERASDETWLERMKRFAALIAALIVAGALFVWDQLGSAWNVVSPKFHSLVVGPTRTTYGMMRGATVKRYGIEQSRFRIVVPIALLLLLFGVALLNSLVGENWLPGHHGSTSTATQQGSTVLQITPSSSSGGKGGGSSNGSNAAQGGNGTPQATSQATQAAGSRGSGLQSSPASSLGGASSAVGGLGGGGSAGGTGGGSGGGGTSSPVTVPSVTVPSVPSVPSTPVTGGSGGSSGGSGGGSGGGGGCLCQTVGNTLNQAQGTVNNAVNQAPQTLSPVTQPVNNVTQPVTAPVTQQVQSTAGGLGL